ncbi:mobilization protein [Streptomyces sp. Isolate_45]|uniref:relaxase/mobilization nuclease domain-containing protein n=1 Tax=Streptomyces sp. Isolate_45 TaxID=2950111 RepID=UPI002481DD6B|nr:mobilization protein [Streptomyces sp. Isolate_45]MDA5279878.1 mobilization protein [Streptomyces sp. Isolate_45]
MVAAWAPYVGDPARSPGTSLADLALLLDAPVYALKGKKPPLPVFHVAVRNAPEDRILTDDEWARIAREMMHASGIHPHGDDQACRWVAVRHADDHIHIVATRAREDGKQPDLGWSKLRMQAAARGFEVELGLRRLTHGDGTPRKWPKTGEKEKAERRGLSEPVRVTLQRVVREAAAAATNETDFFARLGTAGVRVQQRIAPDGNITGYSVAMPGDRDSAHTPIFFSGSKLAPDLSLPRVRERWQTPIPSVASVGQLWRLAEAKVREAGEELGAGGRSEGAGEVAALGDLIVVAAVTAPRLVRRQLKEAAYEFERASRAPGDRALEGQARGLYRQSARTLSQSVSAVGRNDTAAALGFLLSLVTAVDAAIRWHQAQTHRAQAEAAGRAGRLLREAVEVTAGANAARGFRPRTRTPRPGSARRGAAAPGNRSVMTAVVQEALPRQAPAILVDAAWPSLRARLLEIQRSGNDPVEVLTAVAASRELASADSVAEVLVWRLYGWERQRQEAVAATTRPASETTGGKGRPSGPIRGRAPSEPGRRPPGDEPFKGPRRAR